MKPKLKRDWVGRHVRLRFDVHTKGGTLFKAGEVMRVIKNYGGLSLTRVKRCDACAHELSHFVVGVQEREVTLLSEDYQPVEQVDEVVIDLITRGPGNWDATLMIDDAVHSMAAWIAHNRPPGEYKLVLVKEEQG